MYHRSQDHVCDLHITNVNMLLNISHLFTQVQFTTTQSSASCTAGLGSIPIREPFGFLSLSNSSADVDVGK